MYEEQQNIIIVDNIWSNVDKVRKFALTLTYDTENFGQHFWRTPAQLDMGMIPVLEKYVGSTILRDHFWEVPPDPTKHHHMNMTFYKVINQSGDNAWANHIHHDGADWTGIIYLDPDMGPEVGTQLWKHKLSGDEFAFGRTNHVKKNDGGYERFWDKRCESPEEFIPTDYLAYKYNRMVLFKGGMFHSAVYPPTLPDQSRLSMFLYFNVEY